MTAATGEALSTSESEEMYLIHIAMAQERGIEAHVPLSHLAHMLSISAVSVNQMVKKLAARNLVEYLPYKGVDFTAAGRRVALRVLRGRRLWSLFLADQLDMPPARAEEIACDLEHVTPPELADRLADLLGDPRFGPGGGPIPPSAAERPAPEPLISLPDLTVGGRGTVTATNSSPAAGSFLSAHGMEPGTEITLLARGEGGDCLVGTSGGEVHLSAGVAAGVRVRPGGLR